MVWLNYCHCSACIHILQFQPEYKSYVELYQQKQTIFNNSYVYIVNIFTYALIYENHALWTIFLRWTGINGSRLILDTASFTWEVAISNAVSNIQNGALPQKTEACRHFKKEETSSEMFFPLWEVLFSCEDRAVKENSETWRCIRRIQQKSETSRIFGPRSWRTDLAAIGPYAMISGQIFPRPALPRSQ